ncbi:hypothetical protein [Jannaschia faecimaris]|uniref:hypothetical protein n=1 Tax=Jannaschia faecimaris TaxID=1244108 RepID=UPI0011136A84|nr:hypothetical protein [Jannaschia faecimaris]
MLGKTVGLFSTKIAKERPQERSIAYLEAKLEKLLKRSGVPVEMEGETKDIAEYARKSAVD